MRITQYVRTNKRKVFKTNYLLCASMCFLGIFPALGLTYGSKELNRAMWKGALLGLPQIPALFYLWKFVFIDLLNTQPTVRIVSFLTLLILYIAYLIAFACLYKTE